jgi:hypothetical protein
MTPEIHFSVPSTNPEAFSEEWQEWNEAVEASAPIERAPQDFIREKEELDEISLSSEETEHLYEEWAKYYQGQDLPDMTN